MLLLDNFEHVAQAAGLVSELLAAAPHVKVLATSRAALHIYGEHEIEVPPLAFPDPQEAPVAETVATYPAVALFLARAQAVRRDLRITPDNASAIAAICSRLDGLPLAIELAAARSKLFDPAALLVQLHSRLAVLVGGPRDRAARQQTLRATLAWSYELLAPRDRALFQWLAVFAGGCTPAAADAVAAMAKQTAGVPISVAEGLELLVDQHLLRRIAGSDGDERFVMLETIREYALECLAASGDADTARRRHARYFLALAHVAEAHLHGPEQGRWLTALATEHDNLRAALLASEADDSIDDQQRLAVLEQLADVHRLVGTRSRAVRLYREALDLWRRIPDANRQSGLRLHRKIVQTVVEMKFRVDWSTWNAARTTGAIGRNELDALLEAFAGEPPQSELVGLLVELAHDSIEFVAPPAWTEAQHFAEAAVHTARQLDAPAELSAALAALAGTYYGQGALQQHVEITEQRLALLNDPRLSNPRERLDILLDASQALRAVGQYADAVAYAQEAGRLAGTLQAVDVEMETILIQAQCHFRLDQWDAVLELDRRRAELEQRFPAERLGPTCVVIGFSAGVYALRGAAEEARRRRDQTRTLMLGYAGQFSTWSRSQHY